MSEDKVGSLTMTGAMAEVVGDLQTALVGGCG